MKATILLSSLLLLIQFGFSQETTEILPEDQMTLSDSGSRTVANLRNVPEAITTPESTTLEEAIASRLMSFQQTRTAIRELRNYLASNIVFDESLTQLGMEGMVVVEVEIDQKGTITHTRIVKSLNEKIDAEVERVVQSKQNIDISDGAYTGMERLSIPIHFTLKN